MKQICVIPPKLDFTFEEFFKSDYAKQLDVSNVTSDPKILNNIMTTICCLLQPIRSLCNLYTIDVTGTPDPKRNYSLVRRFKTDTAGIIITGGYRSQALIAACKNKLGVVMSKTGHPDGQCADIKRTSWSNLMLFCVLKALHNEGLISVDQLIYEYDTNCCHVGYKATGNREQVLIRKNINGNLVYGSV